ncbi:MAG: threonine synthase [Candidatus Lokiarchaeota archaeon]|nr:threonine synthase [Candidatus Lokiarchaeota archaeon]
MFSYITHLECPQCHRIHSADAKASYCVCGSPLFAIYDMMSVIDEIQAGMFPSKINSLWRYSQLLPVKSPSFVVRLGEGWTPLLTTRQLGKHVGLKLLRIKNEAMNPTQSFKDRGLCVAISKHLELGAKSFALPSAGNAGVSTSAYSAAAGVLAKIFMPEDTPEPFFRTCQMYGADIEKVSGTITDAGRVMKEYDGGWTDLSTTKEPYRVEGKKTLGFEIAEQMGWSMPDAIICPTGGGTALIGIWKAVEELEAIGLLDYKKPRLYAAQSAGCAPVVRAMEKNALTIEPWDNGETEAYGLRVPSPFADRLILGALRGSGGGAVAVIEQEIRAARSIAARMEGIDFCPEAAVGLAGIRHLVESGDIDYDEDVVLLNTGSGSRYPYHHPG